MIANGGAVQASEVCVINHAGFVLGYYFDDLISGEVTQEGDSYPIGQTHCTKLSDAIITVQEGDFIEVEVHAHGGIVQEGDAAVIYAEAGPTVTFECTGTTLIFSCGLLGQETEATKAVESALNALQ